MRYKVVLHHDEEGFSVSCPALPGCHSQGESENDALENIADAIREYMAVINERDLDGVIREIEVEV